ncbi:MAG: mechanosensitive ion channel family protein, partial [Cyanobacteria bacterium P01_A01_bin.17]
MMLPSWLGRARFWGALLAISLTLGSPALAQSGPSPSPSAAPAASPEPLPAGVITMPESLESWVVLQGKQLFEIKAGVGSFSPKFRAQTISQRLRKLARRNDLKVDALTIVDNQQTQTTDIRIDNETLVTILDADAKAANTTRQQLAETNLSDIKAAVQAYRESFQLQNILLGLLYATLLTIVTVGLFTLANRSIAILNRNLRTWQGNRIRGLRLFRAEIVPADRVVDVLTEVLKLLRLTVFVLLGIIYLNLILSFFPWTQGAARRLFKFMGWTLERFWGQIVTYLPNLFFLGLIIVLTNYTLRLIRFFFTEIRRGDINIPGFYPEWAKPTYNLVRFVVIAFAATIAFPYLPGAQTPAFQGISVFIGVLFSLGSSGAVANFVAGIILTYSRAFVVGDRVKISDSIGDVVEKTLLVTRINTIKNVIVTIPNAMVLGSHIINYSGSVRDPKTPPLILHTTITLGYDVPWRKVHEVLIKSAQATEHILEDPLPFVLQTSLDDFYVSYELNAYTRNPAIMAKIYSELHQHLQDQCNAIGIEILSPHYSAARDGNQLAIPEEYFPKDYQAATHDRAARWSCSTRSARRVFCRAQS